MGGIGKSIGKAFGGITKFADDVLGFDPNGGGFVPYYDIAGTALGVGPVGAIGSTAVKAGQLINGVGGQGGQQGNNPLGQILGAVGAGVSQKQQNDEQKKLRDTLLSYVDKGINTQKDLYNQSLGLQNKVLSDVPNLINYAQDESANILKENTAKGLNALTSSGGQSLSELAKAQGMSVDQLQQGFGKGIKNLQPYKESGDRGLSSLTDLTLNPQSQANLIKNNPFYNSLVNDAQSRLTKNQATRGKLGSGDTAKALQDEVLKIGSDLMQQELSNRNNLANYGINASQGQASLNQGLGSALANIYSDTARSGNDIRQNTANNVAGLNQGLGSALFNNVNNNAQFKGKLQQAGANNISDLNTGLGRNLSDLFGIQAGIVGNEMVRNASPYQAGIAQFVQPQQGGQQQGGGGLGGILGNIGGLFGGGDLLSSSGGSSGLGGLFSSGSSGLGSLFSGAGGSTFASGGGGSFGSFGTSGFGV